MSSAELHYAHLAKAKVVAGSVGVALVGITLLMSWLGVESIARWVLFALGVPSLIGASVLQMRQARAFIVMREKQGATFKEARDEWTRMQAPD